MYGRHPRQIAHHFIEKKISAIDSNILLGILIPNPAFVEAMEDRASNGALVVSDNICDPPAQFS